MKKLATTLFISLIVVGFVILGSLPVSAASRTNSTSVTANFTSFLSYGRSYSLAGYSTHTFTREVNRGHVDVLISGDGSTDLDLYVYIGGRWLKSESNSDDEKICLGEITRSGYIKIMVVNRGGYSNDYQLIIK